MIRFHVRLGLFLLIPIACSLLFIWVTPVNLYTFRSWEAVSPYLIKFDGSFYPNQRIEMVEVGDLAVRTTYAVEKDVVFVTDAYGERYAGPPLDQYDVIIFGDSNVVGSGLTQDDTIASVLAAETGWSVYPFHGSLHELLNAPHLTKSRPHLIIFVQVERNLGGPYHCPVELPDQWPEPTAAAPRYATPNIPVFVDRLLRQQVDLPEYLRARHTEKSLIVNAAARMVFYEESLAPPDPAPASGQDVGVSLARCAHWIEAQGIEFLFMPIPDKENIYFDLIPDAARPVLVGPREQYLRDLITQTRAAGVTVIDLLTAYQIARRDGLIPYQLDDTHWSVSGVKIAARAIIAEAD